MFDGDHNAFGDVDFVVVVVVLVVDSVSAESVC